ncbi:MAG: selenocysteine-specific translation elongation factor [Anaerolineales bacterium]|jgi:selenocysteine-specific elongation factor|nr:selenocysteine-specific translation elongation factor [Anaerolineales bacterium]
MHVIGTAGHVDHGKSTLIQALTGVHPDRLKEERERAMTIDLGFAWMSLPDPATGGEQEVGIIDVPGHRDFIGNMLAGVGGIDAALFVVAADEGVMPQTREHLAILDLLQIEGGVVALTKIDLVGDPDWLDLVESDVRETLQGTALANAPIVRLSARSGAGLDELRRELGKLLAERPPRLDLGRPRLPVDRVFTIAGFGTVATGTLVDGTLQVGDEVEILPARLRGRVRGLQTHKHKEQTAVPGSRTAVNVSGIALEDLRRGDVIAHPGDYQTAQRLDVRFRLLPEASQPLKHNTQVKLFIGAAEAVARLRLLGVDELPPGGQGWLQLELSQPVVAARGDRYILRRPSPGETLGGGEVVDPQPKGRYKRFSPTALNRLEALAQGDPADVLLQALAAGGAATFKEALAQSGLDKSAAEAALSELLQTGGALRLEAKSGASGFAPDDLFIARAQWEKLAQRLLAETRAYHRSYPLRRGIPREELKSRLKDLTRGSARLFNAAVRRLAEQDSLREAGPLAYLPKHAIRFTPEQERRASALLNRFAAAPFAPPSAKEAQAELGEELFDALIETGQLTAAAPDVVFRTQDYERLVAEVRRLIEANGSLTVAQARDHFDTSRRYILALLEHLDALGVTVRSGDERRLRR